MIGIYLIINSFNGMQYVGSSANISVRFSYHIEKLNKNCHDNQYLQNAWNKYGGDAFIFAVVEETTIDDLIKVEQLWLDGVADCYNLAKVAGSTRGVKRLKPRSEAQKKAKPPSWTGKKHSDESKSKIADTLRGRKHSSERCKNISIGLKKRLALLDDLKFLK